MCTYNHNLPGYKHHLNSIGKVKGLAIYCNEVNYHHVEDTKMEKMQITKISSDDVDIVAFYRSKECCVKMFPNKSLTLISRDHMRVICRDMNICFVANRNNQAH